MYYYKKESIVGWFIFINILTLTQGIVPAFDSIYRLLLLLIFAISFLYAYKVNSEYGESGFIKSLNLLILLFTIYGLFNILNPIAATYYILPDYRPYTYLTNAYRPLVQIYPLYYFSRKGYIDKNVIKSWVLPSVLIAVIAYAAKQQSLSGAIATPDGVETTNNTGYIMVSLIPMLFFIHKSAIKYILLSLIAAFVFVSSKRGAIVLAVLAACWFVYYDFKYLSTKKRMWIIPLVLVLGTFVYRLLYGIFEDSYYMQYVYEKTLEGNSSGRDILFSRAWDYFENKSTFLTIILGNGADSTYSILGNRAHNDWLEFLINQGVFGFFVYAHFWITIIYIWLKHKSWNFFYMVLH